jgi:hypothetical protein
MCASDMFARAADNTISGILALHHRPHAIDLLSL